MDNLNSLEQRRSQLKSKLEQNRAFIRDDIKELKEDINPLRTAGNIVKNMLNPAGSARLTDSNVLNFGLDTGISFLVNRFIPGTGHNVARVLGPVLIKNLTSHVVPKLRDTSVTFLEWVVEKTKKPEHAEGSYRHMRGYPSSEGEIETELGAFVG